MRLFIARHGEASFDAPSDHERPLTERGIAVTERLVEQNLAQLQEVDAIWCSRLTRAIQTASIYSKALSLSASQKPYLSPDSSPGAVLKALDEEAQDQTLLLVSHQPLVGDLVSLLCGDNVYLGHPFTTSEVVVLEMDYPAAGLASKVANFLPSLS